MRPPALAVALLAGLAAAAAWISSAPAAQPMPVETYSRECGACHMAYPGQLLPTRSWQALLRDLDHHFGENASLDPATVATIAAYLRANAADAGGRRTPVLEGLGPNDVPLRITDTPFWHEVHEEVSPARFRSARVKTRSNCLACHRGGSGGDGD
ncbi:MAG: diheme cytochrome c [Dongiaceae bacterium]